MQALLTNLVGQSWQVLATRHLGILGHSDTTKLFHVSLTMGDACWFL